MDAPNDQSSFLTEQSCMNGSSSGEREVYRKKYQRRTSYQIQELETFFKECSHPDENQRDALSRRLGLEIRQIKAWFQNRRTHLKAQSGRNENKLLKEENEKLRTGNELLKHAYANALCHSCGGTTLPASVLFEHEQLLTENAQLKHELQQVSSFIIGQLPSSQ